ncbi:glycosyltransferase family 2 protein [Nostoc sp. UCD121]|uniref:glycosyltransferase family 2 protein n=1 Tax=unclassified Nostoc TaxID=2593658 RepID=UPI00162AB1C7|nr:MULTISPECIES: glycosyltransferase family 2 protein [unclassified Nostoc]MBC1225146.1 glycosyltransferase family 2 protein [Nostoc sp. UCD120]MBC1278928.1 glycosyltransferase family 2 protein [Nostoc sp. UCD121]MBC1295090.1 glycosyltransferase family 2 protein [Nostoc sp. UCD122]
MSISPLVSILIPVYNAEPYLRETLDSALNQTWRNIEIILVDDGSKDDSLAIAKSYESKGVKVISQGQNKGQTAALNRCLAEAKGDFIQYLDADDILEPQKIEVQIKRLLEEPSGTLAIAPWARFYQNDLSTAKFVPNNDWCDFDDPIAWLVECWTGHGTMPPGSWLYPREIIEKTGLWHEELTLNNDMEYFTRAVLASRRLVFCPEAKWYYRSGNPSLSGQRSEKALWSQYEVIRLSTERLLSVENSDRTRYATACSWQYFVFLAYHRLPELVQYAEKKITELGGCDLKPDGGSLFRVLRDIFGWKAAMNLQRFYYRYRYQINY